MKITTIVKESLRYPFSDWKKILLLGVILLVSQLLVIIQSASLISISNIVLLWFLGIIAFLLGFIIKGYEFRIIKFSVEGLSKIPRLENWTGMFNDGIKLFIVTIIYSIPAFLILLFFVTLSFASNPSTVISALSGLFIGILMGSIKLTPLHTWAGNWFFIALIYMLIIIPIIAFSIAHMANNESKLSAAFRFKEIFNKITTIGWKNLIIWYILTGSIYLIIIFVIGFIIGFVILLILAASIPSAIISSNVGLISSEFVSKVILITIVVPYFYIYLGRSIALFYISK